MLWKKKKPKAPSPKDRRIYISDLDGTLLLNAACLSHFTKQRLKSLISTGVNFTVASARSTNSIQRVLRGVPIQLPVIGINGAYISDFKTGKHMVINNMDRPLAFDVYRRIRKHQCMPFVSTSHAAHDCLYYQDLINEGMQWYFNNRKQNLDRRLRHIANLKHSFNGLVVALTVINTYDKIKPLADEMFATYQDQMEMHFFENPYSPPWYWLTIHDKRACKSQAIRYVLEHSGLELDDLVVFGDSLNDVRMFETVKHAIAVENATDHLKEYATEIIGSNETDSVVKYIIADQIKLSQTDEN